MKTYYKALYILLGLLVLFIMIPVNWYVSVLKRLGFGTSLESFPVTPKTIYIVFTLLALIILGLFINHKNLAALRAFIKSEGWTFDRKPIKGPPRGFGLEDLDLVCFADRHVRKIGVRPIRTYDTITGHYKGYDFVSCQVKNTRGEALGRVVCLLNQTPMPRFFFRRKHMSADHEVTLERRIPSMPANLEFNDPLLNEHLVLRGEAEAEAFFHEAKRHVLASHLALLTGHPKHFVFGGAGKVFYSHGNSHNVDDFLNQFDTTIEFAALMNSDVKKVHMRHIHGVTE